MQEHEIGEIARAVTPFRPDWNAPGLATFLRRRVLDGVEPISDPKQLAGRSADEVHLALLYVAKWRPDSKTPQLVLERGPWWDWAREACAKAPTAAGAGPTCPQHSGERAGYGCRKCARERLDEQVRSREQVAQRGAGDGDAVASRVAALRRVARTAAVRPCTPLSGPNGLHGESGARDAATGPPVAPSASPQDPASRGPAPISAPTLGS